MTVGMMVPVVLPLLLPAGEWVVEEHRVAVIVPLGEMVGETLALGSAERLFDGDGVREADGQADREAVSEASGEAVREGDVVADSDAETVGEALPVPKKEVEGLGDVEALSVPEPEAVPCSDGEVLAHCVLDTLLLAESVSVAVARLLAVGVDDADTVAVAEP